MDAKTLHEIMQRAPHDGKPYRLARAALAALQPEPQIVARERISDPGAAVEVTRLHLRPQARPSTEAQPGEPEASPGQADPTRIGPR